MGTRVQVLSDLHADVAPVAPPRLAPGADVVVVAGDVMAGVERGFAYLRRSLGPDVPVVVAAGNHEFYHSDVGTELAAARAAAPGYGITFLDDAFADVAGLRFAGATLWTDFDLYDDRRAAMAAAAAFLNDHSAIADFSPADARAVHAGSRRFLARTPCDVVVTHHAPSPRSVERRYVGHMLTPAFASGLDDLVARRAPALWVHGHVHHSCDYRIGATRVVCNAHGYGRENPGYDPALVIEVEPRRGRADA